MSAMTDSEMECGTESWRRWDQDGRKPRAPAFRLGKVFVERLTWQSLVAERLLEGRGSATVLLRRSEMLKS